jgi:hypothetical protein
MIPPKTKKKITMLMIETTNMATNDGQNILPNVTFFSDILIGLFLPNLKINNGFYFIFL